jgi:hypothetical protein
MRANTHLLRTLLVGSFFPLTTGVVSAQSRDPSELRPVLQRAQVNNWYVRIRLDADSVQGRVRFLRDSVATVGQSRVHFRDVQLLERRARQGGVTTGSAVAGGLLFGSVTYLLGSSLCECSPTPLSYALPGLMLGAVAGGMFGHATDPGSIIWLPVWADPSAAPAREVMVDFVPPRPRGGIRVDSVPRRSRSGVTAFAGALVWVTADREPYQFPALLGLNINRDAGNLEVVPLSFTIAFLPEVLSAQTGVNYRSRSVYLGASGGVAIGDFEGAVVGLRLGVGDSRYSAFQVEGLVNTFISEGLHPVGYVVLGYTVRRR